MGGLLQLVQRGWTWAGCGPTHPFLAVPNVTAHPSVYQLYIIWCGTIIAFGLQLQYTVVYDITVISAVQSAEVITGWRMRGVFQQSLGHFPLEHIPPEPFPLPHNSPPRLAHFTDC